MLICMHKILFRHEVTFVCIHIMPIPSRVVFICMHIRMSPCREVGWCMGSGLLWETEILPFGDGAEPQWWMEGLDYSRWKKLQVRQVGLSVEVRRKL